MNERFLENIGVDAAFVGNRIKGRLYSRPGDFIVEEILENGAVCSVKRGNTKIVQCAQKQFVHATLVKKGISTFEACVELAEANGLDYFTEVGFCGLKDTTGWTAQRICFKNTGSIKSNGFKGFFLKDFSFSDEKLSIGAHYGNRFTVRVRSVETAKDTAGKLLAKSEETLRKGLPNFYGPQRFGIRQNNHELGKLLLKNRYSDFIFEFLTFSRNECKEIELARKQLKENFGDWEACLKLVGENQGLKAEKTVILSLLNHSGEVEAIRNMKLSNFFVHAYSSYLFNCALSRFLKKRHENAKIEKLGRNSKLDELNEELFAPILEKEKIVLEDFNQPEALLKVNPHSRDSLCYPKNFSYSIGKSDITLRFDLEKGQYASVCLGFIIENGFWKLD